MRRFSAIICSLLVSLIVFTNDVAGQRFSVSFPDSLLKEPFTGQVLLYLSKNTPDPKDGNVGLDLFPCFRVSVTGLTPGAAVVFDDKAICYPVPLSDIERGQYYVQAVFDRNLGGRGIGSSPGNLYSATQQVNLTKNFKETFKLVATKKIPAPTFMETPYVKELRVPSALLRKFHHTPYTLNAAVRLPKEYDTQPDRKFPVLFYVFGYGGDYHNLSGEGRPSQGIDTIPCITVYLDGNCPMGHSVYANSDNNGPWGDALVTELVPQLEKTYRCNGARLLTGHSSGGWSVLWLQTHYPKVFDGCWSSSPDPVDYHSFQRINLYDNQNMFYGKDSSLNQVGTVAGFIPWFSMRSTYGMEHVIYRGEQMHSFNAVLGGKGSDGLPQSICNEKTGAIDSTVFAHWKKYDIAAYLVENWGKLQQDLDGKIRVTVGLGDNFLLNHSVKLLEEHLKKLHARAEVTYYPGDHFTVGTPQFGKDGFSFLAGRYQDWVLRHSTSAR